MTPMTEAGGRYLRRGGAALLVYVAASGLLAVWIASSRPPRSLLLYPLAIAPGLPVLAAVAATSRYFVEEADPLQRVIQIEALLWAVGVTFCVATVWGFLEPLAHAPAVPSYSAFAVFCSVVVSVQMARRRFPRAPCRPGLDGT